MHASAHCCRVAAWQPHQTINPADTATHKRPNGRKEQAMLTPTMNSVPRQVFTWALRQETWLHRKLQQAALRTARAQAFARFAEEHPVWAESLFDEHFLSHAAAPLIARAIEPANRPTASELAAAWFAQCAAPGATVQDANLSEVTVAASAFLHYLDAALQPYQPITR